MSDAISLRVTTPVSVAVNETGVVSIRAQDASGDFGILPGHADLLTVLDASILRWRSEGKNWRFCAVRGAVLRVSDGERVDVACREAVPGDDLGALEMLVRQKMADEDDAARRARAEQTRLHVSAIRALMQRMNPKPGVEDLMEDFR
jgi:F-type H+-transporting ATPase subunit epsilon